jgi:hypothetical protein
MASRDEFLRHLWQTQLIAYLDESWIDEKLRMSNRFPNAPFADLGPLLTRLLTLGASRRELSLFARAIAYENVFSTLYAFDGHPGVEGNDLALYESLLSADPSGRDGRPGSAPSAEI